MRILIAFLLLALCCGPAVAMEDSTCSDTESLRTLSWIPGLTNEREKSFHRCSIIVKDLESAGKSMADLPPLLQPEPLAALTNGDPADGELYSLAVDGPDLVGGQRVRLVIIVPECVRYGGMAPAPLHRLGVAVYYGQVEVTPDVADEVCRAAAAWCDDCE